MTFVRIKSTLEAAKQKIEFKNILYVFIALIYSFFTIFSHPLGIPFEWQKVDEHFFVCLPQSFLHLLLCGVQSNVKRFCALSLIAQFPWCEIEFCFSVSNVIHTGTSLKRLVVAAQCSIQWPLDLRASRRTVHL